MNGKITGIAPGTATITAEANGITRSIRVSVVSGRITLGSTSITVEKGKTKTIKVKIEGEEKTAKWTSSDTSIATVDQNGKVKGIKKGTTTITVAANGIAKQVKVKVEDINYKTLFRSYLKNHSSLKEDYEFDLEDIDKDGVPELFGIGIDHAAGVRMFYISHNKVKKFIGLEGLWYQKSNHRLQTYYTGTGWHGDEYYFYRKGNLKKLASSECDLDDYDESYNCKWNGKSVSPETYERNQKKYEISYATYGIDYEHDYGVSYSRMLSMLS